MSDTQIEAGQSDALVEMVRDALMRAYGARYTHGSHAAGSTFRFAATFVVDRLRADGMADIAIWRVLVKGEKKRVCYCKPGICQAPVGFACIGRRAQDELDEFAVAMAAKAKLVIGGPSDNPQTFSGDASALGMLGDAASGVVQVIGLIVTGGDGC